MAGFIKLFRRLIDWEWYQDTNTKCVFLHLLLLAQHEERRWMGRPIQRGQVVTSHARLVSELGMSLQNIRTALNNLQRSGEIIKNSTNKYTIITICKWDDYQCPTNEDQQTNNKQITNQQQANNNQTTNQQQTTNNIQECKEYKEDNNSSSTYTRACACERDEFEKMKEEDGMIELVAMLNHISKEEVLAKIDEFKAHCQVGMNEHASQTDIRRHFRDWVRIRTAEEKRQQNYGRKYKQDNPRGEFEPTPNADYSAPI